MVNSKKAYMKSTKNTQVKQTVTSYSAGLLLLGNAILGNPAISKAAEDYFKNPEEQAIKMYNLFEEKVEEEIKRRRENLENIDEIFLLDSMMEETLLGSSYDRTLKSQEKLKDFITDVYKDNGTGLISI